MSNKFVIHKGVDNEYVFVIKASGSLSPMPVTSSSDTFKFTLHPIENTDIVARTYTVGSGVSIVDAEQGKIKLVVSEVDASTLNAYKGEIVHSSYLKPAYELKLVASTQHNGIFIAKVGKVYVDD